jgi:putative ABC transport system permease protein
MEAQSAHPKKRALEMFLAIVNQNTLARREQAATVPPASGRRYGLPVPLYLAGKDIWRNRGRYFLISLVVALITTLVLFVAGLAEGLGSGNREYIEKLDAQLILYQANVDLSIPSSRLDWSKMREVRRVTGVEAAGFIGFSSASIMRGDLPALKVSLLGVQPGQPGEPAVVTGRGLQSSRANEVVIDANVAQQAGLKVGDTLTLKSTLGAEEEFHQLSVVGLTGSQKYSIQPSIFVPNQTWDKIRPRSANPQPNEEQVFNLIAVRSGADFAAMQERLTDHVREVEVVDKITAYQNTPGYQAQQSTLNTQRIFTIIIGVLVLGGFFQIQTLQKVAQVGMLKAIGASSAAILLISIIQIISINLMGVAIGGVGTFLLPLGLPPEIPIIFRGDAVTSALFSLMLIGPIGGLVSIFTLLRAEPLKALGLAS